MTALRSIEDVLSEYGPWYLLMRVHGHVWNDKGWDLAVRREACRALSQRVNAVLSTGAWKRYVT